MNMTESRNGLLIITRHGTSNGNADGRWTGTYDAPLTKKGFEESHLLAQQFMRTGIVFDRIYTSKLQRTIHTARVIEEELGAGTIPTENIAALNERALGKYTWLKKAHVIDEIGQEAFERYRTDWSLRVPGDPSRGVEEGESLNDVVDRVIPLFEGTIIPQVKEGKKILVVTHNNVLKVATRHLALPGEREGRENILFDNCETHTYTYAPGGKLLSHEAFIVAPAA